MSRTIGVDLSYGSCGVIAIDTDTAELLEQKVISTTTENSEIERARQVWNEISALIIAPVDIIVVEGLAFAKGEKAHQMGYLHYRIREYLQAHEIHPQVLVPAPTQLKKFVAGTGQCKKELMLLKVYKRWQVEFGVNDLADAYGLARLGMAYVGAETDLIKTQQEVIAALKGEKPVAKKKKGKVE